MNKKASFRKLEPLTTKKNYVLIDYVGGSVL